ncbi:PREDICTED: HEAT repeat-containing protein 1-like [Acropora digitifera]|uniref:HEAT repeat-containing protein 1-like n=1 Tax=Acropora digitifera TaxID=70779 RepID=UPI00077AEB2B|nr:PREDICTED: HEAT repeat-containing protein 1-like [Acropora digitifera]
MKALLKVSGLVKIFHHVSSTHIVTPLLDIFVPQLVATGLKNAISEEPENSDMNSWLDVAEQMIQDVDFEKGSIVILTRTLLEEYCHQRDIHDSNKNEISRLNTKVKVLMEALQKKYPTELEKAIELHMDFIKGTADSSEGGTNQKALKWTTELISFALTMVKSQVIPDSSTTLFLSLHHPQAEVRQMAVKRLGELLRGKEELSEDKEFITEALLSRLHDDNPIIVSCVLKLGQVCIL